MTKASVLTLHAKENEKSPVRGGGGQGEWEDWDGDSYSLDAPSADDDDDDVPLMPSMSLMAALSDAGQSIGQIPSLKKEPPREDKKKVKKSVEYDDEGYEIEDTWKLGGTGASTSAWSDSDEADFFGGESSSSSSSVSTNGRYDDWEGFNEEPPYFDEKEVMDDDDYTGYLASPSSPSSSVSTAVASQDPQTVGDADTNRRLDEITRRIDRLNNTMLANNLLVFLVFLAILTRR